MIRIRRNVSSVKNAGWRIHLGHHFYGAGNLGDDFMLAGFLSAMRPLAPGATFTCCVPFPLPPLQARFPEIAWLPCDDENRSRAIAACDVWLGLGGSPFQSALSSWFIAHLQTEAAWCARGGKPMYYLGIGVQDTAELAHPLVQHLCAQAAAIWTRDARSAESIAGLPAAPRVEAAADLAHGYFQASPPPRAEKGRVTLVANFDYGSWPGQTACLEAIEKLSVEDRVWLGQEARELPGAERALFAALPPESKARWRFVSPDLPGAPLQATLARWPSGEWLITSRYHAAMAGAWAGSKIVVLATNEKLRAAAQELEARLVPPEADEDTFARALQSTAPAAPPRELAGRALAACAAFVRAAFGHAKI